MEESRDVNKRQKTSPRSLHIADIPDEALAAVAKFLPKPSQALFAVAMTAPPPSWRDSERKPRPSMTSQAILSLRPKHGGQGGGEREGEHRGEPWSALDFADIEYSLARNLTDDDLLASLVCIDAANRLKSLKLTGCINITGSGLKPLCDSTALEQIDLSLVGKHESPNIWPEPWMSEAVVVPILDSIIDNNENSLKQLQLPKKFRSSPSPLLEHFLERYDELLENCGGTCSKCNATGWGNMDDNGRPWIVEDQESQFYGLQNYTCYECTEHFCMDTCVGLCMECEKDYCMECVPLAECVNCPNKLCEGCGELKKCDVCGDYLCESCVNLRDCCGMLRCNECTPSYKCEYNCGKVHCSCCFGYTKGNDNEECVACGTRACSRCRFLEYRRDPENTCPNCIEIIKKVQCLHAEEGLPFP